MRVSTTIRISANPDRRLMDRLTCPPEEAHRRVKLIEQMGFEEILIGSQFAAIDEIEWCATSLSWGEWFSGMLHAPAAVCGSRYMKPFRTS